MSECKANNNEPTRYLSWHTWAEKKSKNHNQLKCEKCGLFHIWKRKIKGSQNE